ncbi:hypothetical protein AB0H71_16850 [Nocardia sp. NPDC050697]|uniref:hypothetical protein n=1 Tax=Nocardia sp. NPDC050697 TaxID=3155158 RepID=UPI0033D9F372
MGNMVEYLHQLRYEGTSLVNPVAYADFGPESMLQVVIEREALPTIGRSSPQPSGFFAWPVEDTFILWGIFTARDHSSSFAAFFPFESGGNYASALIALQTAFSQCSLLGVEQGNINIREVPEPVSDILENGYGYDANNFFQ